jgi:FkbM family methyltransferase
MPLLSRAHALLDVLASPSSIRQLIVSRPRSLASMRIAKAIHRDCPHFDSIIDGGANIGQFARACATVFPKARIYSFEPQPDVATEFERNLADRPNVSLHRLAIGAQAGTATFLQRAASQESSFLKGIQGTGFQSDSSQERQISVTVTTLDDFFSQQSLGDSCLLKLDLQGFELEALKGATQTLERCKFVLLEAMFEPMYEGEPLFDSLWQVLQSRGFRFARPVAFATNTSHQIVQVDALFSKGPTSDRHSERYHANPGP